MKAFVTGGTGFIGLHVVRKLLDRGYDVVALARSDNGSAVMSAIGAQVVRGDINDVDSMRQGMDGSDVVFHMAGWCKLGSPEWMQAESINVAGTRRVLGLAHELGVPKIVYTSTVSVFGDTRGELVDESYFQAGPFINEYDRTKWLAHYKVAVPMIERGAPIIIVMPGVIYGPGDHSLIGELMHRFYQGNLPVVLAPDFTVTYAHVEDIAEGHILAAEQGRTGESYILAGPAVPLGEIVDFWAQLTGIRAPVVRIPARYLLPLAPVLGALSNTFSLPEPCSRETIESLAVSHMARADKARAELGWRPRSLHDGMGETFRWLAKSAPAVPSVPDRERQIAAVALFTAALLLFLWLLSRRQK